MTFLHPMLALTGLACIAIPILIHFLMRRRRRPIQWAAMRFLLEAYRKHRRRLRLEQLILLATRCLLIALIGLALGRPLLSAAGLLHGGGTTTVYLVLDNSLASSSADEGGGLALDRHKRLADGILSRLDPGEGDRAGLILLGAPAEPVVSPASSDVAGVRSLIAEAMPTDGGADFAGAMASLRAHFADEADGRAGRRIVVILSDFLEGSAAVESILPRLNDGESGARDVAIVATVPAESGPTNVAITRVEPLRAVMLAESGVSSELARQEQVTVHLSRFGPGVRASGVTNIRVRLVGEDGATGQTQHVVSWEPGQTQARASIMAAGALPAGRGVIVAEIDRDGIAGDNVFRRPIEVRQRLRIGLIAPRQVGTAAGLDPLSSADWIRLALQPGATDRRVWSSLEGEDIELVGIEPGAIDAARLAGLDAAIVAAADAVTPDGWRRLGLMAEAGGLVMVLPPGRETAQLWTDYFLDAFGLDWTVAREARQSPEGIGLTVPVGATDASALLSLVSAELEDLVRPVRVWRSLPVRAPAPAEAVLSLSDGSPWIVAGEPGRGGTMENGGRWAGSGSRRGLVVLVGSSFSAEWTDLAGRPLFVPLVHELVRQGIGRAQGSSMEVAGARPALPARAVEMRSIERAWGVSGVVGGRDGGGGEAGSETILVDTEGRAERPLRRAGLWRAVDARGGDRGLVAINADPLAGRTDSVSGGAIAAWLGGLMGGEGQVRWIAAESRGVTLSGGVTEALTPETMLHDPRRDSPLSLPLLQAAIVVALIEILLARWFSHADVRSMGSPTMPQRQSRGTGGRRE